MTDKTKITELLEQYPGLPSEEKERVLQEASHHADLSDLVEEAQRWDKLLSSASANNVTDELLSIYWSKKSGDEYGPLFAAEFARLEEQIDNDEQLARRSEAIRARQQLLDMSSDPAEQFADLQSRLSGRGPGSGRVRERPYVMKRSMFARVAASLLILFLAYSGLRAFDVSQRSPREQLQLQFNEEEAIAMLEEIGRGITTPDGKRATAILKLGVTKYANSRRSWLGIAPTYDEVRMREVARMFKGISEDRNLPDEIRSEAELLYAQALLTLGDFKLGTESLVRARQSNNPTVLPIANRLLTKLLEVR